MARKLLFQYLDDLDIGYEVHNHGPLYTMEDTKGLEFEGIQPKNLVMKDRRDGKIYLVVLNGEKKLDIKHFRRITGASSKVSFLNADELLEVLGISQGECSPFAILNDKTKEVVLVILGDASRLTDDDIVNFHPNVNTQTLSINGKGFRNFLDSIKNPIIIEKNADE